MTGPDYEITDLEMIGENPHISQTAACIGFSSVPLTVKSNFHPHFERAGSS